MRKMIINNSIFMVLLLLLGVSCQKKGELGSSDNPVKIYFTPSVDAETIATNSQDLLKFLHKETGLFFKSGIPTSYVAVVEAFGAERADIAVMNSFGYLMAHSKYGALPLLRTIRYGKDYYQGQILAHVDSGVKSLKDLNGKRFAFTDSSSTSGYMFPLKILKENNIKLGNETFAIKHDNVVTMIYQKQVDAGATFYSTPTEDGRIRDARARVKTQFPDVEEKIKIIAITDKIPNDPFVFRKGLSSEITKKTIAAIKKYLSTEKGREIFKKIYDIEGVLDSSDQDYQVLREMIQSLNLDLNSVVK